MYYVKIGTIIILIIGILLFAEGIRETHVFKGTYYKCKLKKDKVKKTFKACIISDLHGSEFGKNNEKLISKIVDEKPDIILMSGDIITYDKTSTYEVARQFYLDLAKAVKKNGIGNKIFASFGNHELQALTDSSTKKMAQSVIDDAKNAGINILNDESTQVEVKGNKINIMGLTYKKDAYKKFVKNTISKKICMDSLKHSLRNYIEVNQYSTNNKLLNKLNDDSINIVLSHHPDAWQFLKNENIDITVSGHNHGGIVRIPGVGGLITSQIRTKNTHTKGNFVYDNKYLLLSGGLGGHSIPIRLFNIPEVLFIDIE